MWKWVERSLFVKVDPTAASTAVLILSPFFVAIFSQAVSFSRVQLGWRTLKGPVRPGRQGSRDPTADCTRGLVFSSLASLSTYINVGVFLGCGYSDATRACFQFCPVATRSRTENNFPYIPKSLLLADRHYKNNSVKMLTGHFERQTTQLSLSLFLNVFIHCVCTSGLSLDRIGANLIFSM